MYGKDSDSDDQELCVKGGEEKINWLMKRSGTEMMASDDDDDVQQQRRGLKSWKVQCWNW